MKSVIQELDPVRLTVQLECPESGNPENILTLPVGTEGSALIDWGDGFECLFDIPDPDDPGMRCYAQLGVPLDQIELIPKHERMLA